MDLANYYQSSVSIEIYLDLKICFSLVTYKIYNLIALCSTKQIIKISLPWWLIWKISKVSQELLNQTA